MRWPGLILLAAGLLASAGCSSWGTELVESELRARDADLRMLREEMERLKADNEALHFQLHAIHQPTPAVPAVAEPPGAIKRVTLGRQTGGYDNDNCPGDEALQVVLEPRDCDGHAIKASGTLLVQALELTPQGIKKPLCAWQVPPEELRRGWRNGFLSTGYFVQLPWKAFPCTEKVRVVVNFVLPDSRVFEAEKDVIVRLVPLPRQPQLPPPDLIELPLTKGTAPNQPAVAGHVLPPGVPSTAAGQTVNTSLRRAVQVLKPVAIP
jgi:hypothetical protein